jgi:hypothetical protein
MLCYNESYANGGNAPPFSNVSGLGKGTQWAKKRFLIIGVPIDNHDISLPGGSRSWRNKKRTKTPTTSVNR